jgi:hypothetical protein
MQKYVFYGNIRAHVISDILFGLVVINIIHDDEDEDNVSNQ